MNLSLLIPSVSLLGAAQVLAAQAVLPEPYPPSRYEKMAEASPFSLATAAVAPVEKAPGFAVNLFVGGAGRMGDKDWVAVKSKADQTTFYLEGNEPNAEGIALVGIERSEKSGRSKVQIRKGTEHATIEFDQPAPPAMPPPGLVRQPNLNNPGGGPVLPGMNNRGAGAGVRLPVVPRPTSVAPQPAIQPNGLPQQIQAVPNVQGAGQPNAQVPAPAESRRRIRVINSNP